MTHEIAVAAVLTLTLMSGCAAAPGDGGPGGGGIVTGSGATSGGGTGGGDAGGQGGASGNACAEKPPTADPFDCLPTFAEQTQAACAADNGSRQLTAGSCGGLQNLEHRRGLLPHPVHLRRAGRAPLGPAVR